MKADPDSIEEQIKRRRDYDSPPLQLWNPPLSGDIPIRIAADGAWYHDGGRIKRESLVRLFASILRREEDGDYYLVTPAEKWRIQVDRHPLTVTDIDAEQDKGDQVLRATLNTGKVLVVDENHPLVPDLELNGIAVLQLENGLTALFTRTAWYRLVELAEVVKGRTGVRSGGRFYDLTARS